MDTNSKRARLHQWVWIASIWSGFGLVDAMQTVFVMRGEGMHHAWVRLFWTCVVGWVPWALATPFVLWLGRRFPPVKWRPVGTWVVHLAACAGVGLTFAAWMAWMDIAFNPYARHSPSGSFTHVWAEKFDSGILSFLVLYAAIVTVSYVLDSRERLALQQTETARLNELLEPYDLTFPRYEALMLLHFSRRGSLPLGKIGERLQVHRTSVTNIIDKPFVARRLVDLIRVTMLGRA